MIEPYISPKIIDIDNLNTEDLEELKKHLKGSLMVLSSSAPNKRSDYRSLFTLLGKETIDKGTKDEKKYSGVDVFFTDSSALRIIPAKTPEQNNSYDDNLKEKLVQQIIDLQENDRPMRNLLDSAIPTKSNNWRGNVFSPKKISITGLVEDSGWVLAFDSEELEQQFITEVKRLIDDKLSEDAKWLIKDLDKTGFPGPNLKPLQEHLSGGFHEMMKIIYDAAENCNIKDLRYSSNYNIGLSIPEINKGFVKSFTDSGKVISREEYIEKLLNLESGKALNSDLVHIPDKQIKGQEKTAELIKDELLYKSSDKLPADFGRRNFAEWLQDLIGKNETEKLEKKRKINIAYASSDSFENGETPAVSIPMVNGFSTVVIPTREELLKDSRLTQLGEAQVVVLVPEKIKHTSRNLQFDPNLSLALNMAVTVVTDPDSMRVPIILDNRTGRFDSTIELLQSAFFAGRLIGDFPFYVANDDKELETLLKNFKRLLQNSPQLIPPKSDDVDESKPLEKIPNAYVSDEIMSVFVAGGHSNNNKRDLAEAENLGYNLAKNNIRIVSGAGQLEGSMGAVYTGFLRYHLEQIPESEIPSILREHQNENGKYDIATLVKDHSDVLQALCDAKYIPKNMFYGYSTEALIKMESPTKKPPVGITYEDAGNRIRRLDALLAPSTKLFLPGSIGTDEELVETIKQHMEHVDNEKDFHDGARSDEGRVIIYNQDGKLGDILQHFNIDGEQVTAEILKEKYNISVVSNEIELKAAVDERKQTWANNIVDFKRSKTPSFAA